MNAGQVYALFKERGRTDADAAAFLCIVGPQEWTVQVIEGWLSVDPRDVQSVAEFVASE